MMTLVLDESCEIRHYIEEPASVREGCTISRARKTNVLHYLRFVNAQRGFSSVCGFSLDLSLATLVEQSFAPAQLRVCREGWPLNNRYGVLMS